MKRVMLLIVVLIMAISAQADIVTNEDFIYETSGSIFTIKTVALLKDRLVLEVDLSEYENKELGYCVKCRTSREFVEGRLVTMKVTLTLVANGEWEISEIEENVVVL